jgi:hypothetical protein
VNAAVSGGVMVLLNTPEIDFIVLWKSSAACTQHRQDMLTHMHVYLGSQALGLARLQCLGSSRVEYAHARNHTDMLRCSSCGAYSRAQDRQDTPLCGYDMLSNVGESSPSAHSQILSGTRQGFAPQTSATAGPVHVQQQKSFEHSMQHSLDLHTREITWNVRLNSAEIDAVAHGFNRLTVQELQTTHHLAADCLTNTITGAVHLEVQATYDLNLLMS